MPRFQPSVRFDGVIRPTPADDLAQARHAADRQYRRVATMFPSPTKPHPLQLTLQTARATAEAVVSHPRTSIAEKTAAWRALEAKMKELEAICLDPEKRAAAVVAQEALKAAQGAAALANAPEPLPARMTPNQVLDKLAQMAVTVSVAGGNIVLSPRWAVTTEAIDLAREHKAELVALLRADLVEI